MRTILIAACSVSLCVMMGSGHAAERHHRRHVVTPYDHTARYPGSSADWIAAATARAQREPGVTAELAPDAKQTATGGPVGGVPGFDGF